MFKPPPMHQAYLLAKINTKGYPHIDNVRIYSERNPTSSNGETYALILEVTDSSYEKAQETLKRVVKDHTHYQWALPLMDKK